MLRIGILGAGNIARKFCQAAIEVEEACVVAVASKDITRAEKWAAEERVAKAYGSYAEMLADPEIDLVYIATTNNFHFDHILQCLQAGKHVICEKPMTMTLGQAQTAIDLAGKKNLFLMEAMWSRFLPKSAKVREWIHAGLIGTVQLAQATIGWVADRTVNRRVFDPELGGGALYDLGVYPLDLITYYTDQEIREVQSLIKLSDTGIDESVSLDVVLDSCFANMQCSVSAKMPEDLYIYGDLGYIRVPKLHFGVNAYRYDTEDQLVECFEGEDINGFVYEIQEAVKCIGDGRIESRIASHAMTLKSSEIYDICLKELRA